MATDHSSGQHHLSIRIIPDGFSLYITDRNHQLISSRHTDIPGFMLGNPEAEFKKHPEFNVIYKQTTIYVESTAYCLIPPQFDEHESNRHMLEFQIPSTDQPTEIISQEFNSQGFNLIWAVPVQLKNALLKLFPNSALQHHLTDLLTQHFKANELITIWLREGEADFLVYRKQRLILCNALEYKTAEDIVYHTLNFFKQFVLDPDLCEVMIYQDDKSVKVNDLLSKFLPGTTAVSKTLFYENY